MLPGTSRRLTLSENSQAARTTKDGFRNSEGWMPKIQRREPFTSAPNSERGDDEHHRHDEDDERRAPDVAAATGRRRRSSPPAPGTMNSAWRLTKWNMFWMPMRSATAGLAGKQQDDPDQQQRQERREQKTVDGPPPLVEGGSLGAGGHGRHPSRRVKRLELSSVRVSEALRSAADRGGVEARQRRRPPRGSASPRSSKLRNWSKEAQAGDSSTTGSASAGRRRVGGSQARRPASMVPAIDDGHAALERRGERVRRLADQVGLGDARKESAQAAMPPVFGLPPAIQ